MSLLSKKQRAANPYAQVQTLVRIGRRATCHAEWISTFLDNPAYQEPEEQASLRDEIYRSEEKAHAAATEMSAIVAEHPECDWTLPQRRAAERWLREAAVR